MGTERSAPELRERSVFVVRQVACIAAFTLAGV